MRARTAASQRGSVLLLTALLMLLLAGCAGLAVDVQDAYAVRGMLQHAVDDGALSARRWSAQADDSPGGRAAGVAAGAVAEALRVVQQDLQSQGLAGASGVDAALTPGGLVLVARARVRTFFVVLFGIPYWHPEARAEAALWTPPASPPVAGPKGSASVPPSAGAIAAFGASSGGGGNGGAAAAGPPSPSGLQDSPPSSDVTAPGPADVGPCNCDGIAAGDPQAARDALERMGASPASPGPYEGDLTSAMGFGEMQAAPGGGSPSDGGGGTGGEGP